MSFIYALFISSTLAIDLPSDSFNHVKFDFFYKAIFVPQNESERPHIPMNALMPVIIPTSDYRLITKAPVENDDLDGLIWFFNYHESYKSELLCYYRKLMQPGEFTINNLIEFRHSLLNQDDDIRDDIILHTQETIERLYDLAQR